ncbi:hypothetical protein K1W69_12495 [Hoeflea sp. WL0058]|uniref:Uncharacterized protein n=1 Tax=Flavimaribacter sediminis TaxID=2865987 RepID=A0AAE2ZPC3_9HYPH|nr:hypothetical protein [Flavimaribacter sediminis]MBW8638008.1 hypothetical protein [Flavimaribacter sediminis]
MTQARCLFAAESEQTRDAGLRRDLGKLGCDSDLIFQSPIDMLWEPLEQEGLLVTRFFSPPYGIDGAAGRPGFDSRMNHLEDIRELIGDDLHQQTAKRMLDDRIDVNVGLVGIARPTGEDFPADWAAHMEKGRDRKILLMDEMTVVALINRHRRHLADEAWNCPADEFFRRTNL